MKNTLAVIAGVVLLGAAASSYGQTVATIAANNYGSAAGSISTSTGALLGTDAWVQVLAAAAGGAPTAVGDPFHPAEAGYFDNGILKLPGITGGASVSFQVEAWTGAASYAAAANDSKGSVSWTQTAGSYDTTISPPPAPTGPDMQMPAFKLGSGTPIVPEPTTLALAALGAAALLIRRRS